MCAALQAIRAQAEASDQPIIEPPPLSDQEEQGFTDQVRAVFKANPATLLSAVRIRDLMLIRDPQANPKITLIHIHNTLKRLVKHDEISEAQMPDGRTGYRLKPKPVADLMTALKESLERMQNTQAQKAEAIKKIKKLMERQR